MQMSKTTFSLYEISQWGINDGSVSIPALQRGLVWSPKQVEFLWDSILRFFPVGGFVLSENADGTFCLMDGQQRYNAIKTAFVAPDSESDSLLWLDIQPPEVKNSTRHYYAKATTKIHPWGFNNDESCSVLSAGERRDALTSFDMEGENIFKNKISLLETFPVKANFPVPLVFVLQAALQSDNASDFASLVTEKLSGLPASWKEKVDWKSQNTRNLLSSTLSNTYFRLFQRLLKSEQKYTIPCSILSQYSVIQNDEPTDENGQTSLEVLFTRLNTAGTQISQSDLYYSAIKAYWAGIKDTVEALAKHRMPPQNLAMLFFRLAITLKKKSPEKFETNLSISQIRKHAKNEETKFFVEKFINEDGSRIVKIVDEALSELPKYIVMKIITQKADIYLLLLYLASRNVDLVALNADRLAMILYWFSLDVSACVNSIFAYAEKHDIVEISISEIQKLLSDLTALGKFRKMYAPNELKFDSSKRTQADWSTAQNEFWEYISDSREATFLLFAERDFIKNNFPNYNPAEIKGWDKVNCPWDYDHIIPKSWSYNKRYAEHKRLADYWLWRSGNFAAIPFEVNRSKNDRAEYSFYQENSDSLLYDKQIEEITEKFIWDKEMAEKFAELTYQRSLKIYTACYDFVAPYLPTMGEKVRRQIPPTTTILSKIKNSLQKIP